MTTVSVSLATIQATIARALAAGQHDRGRIERAAALIALGAVEQIDSQLFSVASQTENGKRYAVTPDGCSCTDAQRHPGRRCKHDLAVRIILSAEIAERKARDAALAASFSPRELEKLTAVKQRASRVAA